MKANNYNNKIERQRERERERERETEHDLLWIKRVIQWLTILIKYCIWEITIIGGIKGTWW